MLSLAPEYPNRHLNFSGVRQPLLNSQPYRILNGNGLSTSLGLEPFTTATQDKYGSRLDETELQRIGDENTPLAGTQNPVASMTSQGSQLTADEKFPVAIPAFSVPTILALTMDPEASTSDTAEFVHIVESTPVSRSH
jgi:hypothetical protein